MPQKAYKKVKKVIKKRNANKPPKDFRKAQPKKPQSSSMAKTMQKKIVKDENNKISKTINKSIEAICIDRARLAQENLRIVK